MIYDYSVGLLKKFDARAYFVSSLICLISFSATNLKRKRTDDDQTASASNNVTTKATKNIKSGNSPDDNDDVTPPKKAKKNGESKSPSPKSEIESIFVS